MFMIDYDWKKMLLYPQENLIYTTEMIWDHHSNMPCKQLLPFVLWRGLCNFHTALKSSGECMLPIKSHWVREVYGATWTHTCRSWVQWQLWISSLIFKQGCFYSQDAGCGGCWPGFIHSTLTPWTGKKERRVSCWWIISPININHNLNMFIIWHIWYEKYKTVNL